ncbi:MAG: HNH endonuclease [Planctomycetia bacterium]|nr:HNH endonuclease [Planctomycetia bacterium]
MVCAFDFALVYGAVGEGLIHVHHLRELSEIGEEYEVDPIRDLRPVCPNCHFVIHQRRLCFSIDEVRAFLRR